MNNRLGLCPGEAPAYLRSDEAATYLTRLGADLIMQEVQIEFTVHELPFIIPEALQTLFVKYDDPLWPEATSAGMYTFTPCAR